MYGFWIKPDRFVNFQDLYAVYLNQLKALAYKFEDLFTGKTTRLHKPGVDGYIIEASKASDVKEYFTTYAMPKAQFVYEISQTGTIAANLVPGSVLIATEGVYGTIVDNGNGVLKKIDGNTVGTIDYKTGKYSLTIDIADFGKVIVGYAVVGTNVTYTTFGGTVSGTTATVKEIKGAQIMNSQVGLTAQIIVVEDLRKFFVGFTTNDKNCQAKILSEITGKPITVS